MHEQCQHRMSNSKHNRVRSLDRRARAPVGVRSVSALSHMFTHPELFAEISAYALHEFLNTRCGESFSRFRPRSQQGSAWAGIPMPQHQTLQTRPGRWRQSASQACMFHEGGWVFHVFAKQIHLIGRLLGVFALGQFVPIHFQEKCAVTD
jgi:hypothetical protein